MKSFYNKLGRKDRFIYFYLCNDKGIGVITYNFFQIFKLVPMELIFKRANIIVFKYLERFNLRVSVKSAPFEVLRLIYIQSKFLLLFKKLLSNHHELTRDFLKLSANINVSCLFRCSLPLFKQDASILLLSIKSKPLLRQYY